MAFLPLFLRSYGSQTQGMDFLIAFPALAAAVVGFSGLGLVRLLRSDGKEVGHPPESHRPWLAGTSPSAPFANTPSI